MATQVIDPYAQTPDQPETELPPQEPDPAQAPDVPPLAPDPTAPEPEPEPEEEPEREAREIVVSPDRIVEHEIDDGRGIDRRAEGELVLDFRKTPVKGRMPRIEVWVDKMWVPVGVWTFENYPNLSGDDLRDLLIARGLPEADAAWYGIQRAVRLARNEEPAA